jgi:hypothetical protein
LWEALIYKTVGENLSREFSGLSPNLISLSVVNAFQAGFSNDRVPSFTAVPANEK